ncbi:hypothetical protein FS749_008175 [Ceratobasidium sp. UAMH 11750]|nr:hypothetical protein FS749_008175 [Ceratobasidium sp. UAMH 11750]
MSQPSVTPGNSRFRVQTQAVLLTWSALREENASGLVSRFEHFCRNRPSHWRTLAVVERHNPEEANYDPERPLHVHVLTISVDRKNRWNTENSRFWDFEGSHPNIAPKDLREGPGGCPARTAFHYLWKDVGANGEEVEELMAGDLTAEALEEILIKGKGGKRSRMQVRPTPTNHRLQIAHKSTQADLEDGEEIVSAETKEEYYQRFKRLRPLQMVTAWNSVKAYAEHAYRTDAGLLPAIPVELERPAFTPHTEQADRWFEDEHQAVCHDVESPGELESDRRNLLHPRASESSSEPGRTHSHRFP